MTKELHSQAVRSQAMELSPTAFVATAKETKPWPLQPSSMKSGEHSLKSFSFRFGSRQDQAMTDTIHCILVSLT